MGDLVNALSKIPGNKFYLLGSKSRSDKIPDILLELFEDQVINKNQDHTADEDKREIEE